MWSLPSGNNIPPFLKLELTPFQVVPSWKRNAGTLSRAKPGNTLFPSAPRAFWAFWAERGLVVRDRHHFVHFHLHRSLSERLSRIFSPSGERSNFPSLTESRGPRLVKPWWPSVASSRAQGLPPQAASLDRFPQSLSARLGSVEQKSTSDRYWYFKR